MAARHESSEQTALRYTCAMSAQSPVADETAYMDDLQVQMEQIGRQEMPNLGHFCGHCYGRLTDGEDRCRFCGRTITEAPPVDKVPIYVLRVYLAKRRREGIMVNLMAFVGLALAVVVSAVIYFFLTGNWKIIAVISLLFFGWYFANLLGGRLGAGWGYAWGKRVRDRYWVQYLEDRRNGVAPEV
jgi:VIT1/CCC1 family predicted Fe2+/Mn2+ transporter